MRMLPAFGHGDMPCVWLAWNRRPMLSFAGRRHFPAIDFEHSIVTERVTLITGASAGIGTELARVFASKGHRVALVARREERLVQLASEITASGGAAPIVISCDLTQPDAGDRIEAALAAAGVEVEYVVNNAGFGLFGQAIKRDRAEQLNMIAVNIRALTDLSLRFSGQLIKNRGGLLNIGSI